MTFLRVVLIASYVMGGVAMYDANGRTSTAFWLGCMWLPIFVGIEVHDWAERHQ